MTLIRPDGTEGGTHDLRQGENKLGRSFGPVFENDGYLSPIHAQLDIRGMQAVVRDLDSLNGVFVKMTQEEELQSGQIIRIGQELLRFELIGAPEPTADGTELMGSPNPGFWGKLTVIIGRDITGAAFPLLGESCTLGRERGEINFPDDGYVSGLHARVIAARRPRVPDRPRQLERHVHQGQRRARRRPRLVRAPRPAAVPAELRLSRRRSGAAHDRRSETTNALADPRALLVSGARGAYFFDLADVEVVDRRRRRRPSRRT